ncbi:MAG: hypothetical protein JXR12_06630 [Neptunomonas phycophila]|uniref:hypothetical protein n=1 Tax=Neptunomonas phycophila TaxID=1572645 RepID=UPI003B8B4E0C
MPLTIQLTDKQVHDFVEEEIIDDKIKACEAFLDDLDPEDEADAFEQVNKELEEWKALKTQLEFHHNYKE